MAIEPQTTDDARTADFWSPWEQEPREPSYEEELAAYRAQRPAATVRTVEPVPAVYGGTDFELKDAREVDEYRRLRASGEYTDDQVMRLRAMRGTRGDEEVRRLAWKLRRSRDAVLAQRLADANGGRYEDYLVPTRREFLGAPKDRLASAFDSTLAADRDAGDPARALAARRRGMYLAARWGLRFDEDMAPTGRMALVPVRTSSDGWVRTSGNDRFRVGPGGTLEAEGYERRRKKGDEHYAFTREGTGYRPTRPGEPLLRADGTVVRMPVPERKPTGRWNLAAPRDSAFKKWLRENRKR